jgi:hypothetical protein
MKNIENLNSDKINMIKHIYEWNQQVTHFADTKVSALQIINTLIISFSVTFSVRDLSLYSKVVIISAVVLASFSSLMLLLTILPRASREPSTGMNFYTGILKCNCEDYCSKMAEISVDDIIKDYLNSIYTIALIQKTKFIRFRTGLISSFIAITLVGAAIVLNILFYHK